MPIAEYLLELSADSMRRRAVSLFSGLGLVPAYRAPRVTAGAVSWGYTTVVNIVFLLLAAALLVLFFCSGGAPVLKVMVGSPDVHEHARGGVAAWRPRSRGDRHRPAAWRAAGR